MDIIKEKLDGLVEKIKSDPALLKKFQSDPIGVVEKLLDVDLPNDQLKPLADAVKAKLGADKLGDVLGGIGNLFSKK